MTKKDNFSKYQSKVQTFTQSPEFRVIRDNLESSLSIYKEKIEEMMNQLPQYPTEPWTFKSYFRQIQKLVDGNSMEFDFRINNSTTETLQERFDTIFNKKDLINFIDDLIVNKLNSVSIEAIEENCKESFNRFEQQIQKSSFVNMFILWIKNIINEFPEKQNEIFETFRLEFERSSNYFLDIGIYLRPLKGIEEECPEVAMRQILMSYGQIAELAYAPYLKLLYRIFCICNLAKKNDKLTNGALSHNLKDLYNKHFPVYVDLVDYQVVKIRNASAHLNIDDNDETKLTIYNTNSKGKRDFEEQYTVAQLMDKFKELKALVWDGDLYNVYMFVNMLNYLQQFDSFKKSYLKRLEQCKCTLKKFRDDLEVVEVFT